MGNVYSNSDLINGYVETLEERMNITPEIIVSSKDKWMVVKNTDENLVKLDNYVSKTGKKIPEYVKIYFNSPEDYDKILEGIMLSDELNKEKKRQERINNPSINEDIKSIDSKDKLVDFLLEKFYSSNEMLMDEFSGRTYEEDEALLNAEYNELVKLKEKHIN